jgi:hypothetical protein
MTAPTTDAAFAAADEQAVLDVVVASRALFDDSKVAEWSELFAPEAIFDITPEPGNLPLPIVGKADIVGILGGHRSEMGAVLPRLHVVSGYEVTMLDADTARVESNLFVHEGPTAETPITSRGRQIDVLTRAPEGSGPPWRFTARLLRRL